LFGACIATANCECGSRSTTTAEFESESGLIRVSATNGLEIAILRPVRFRDEPQIHQRRTREMKSQKVKVFVLFLLALAALSVANVAKADTWNKATKITFPEPVEVSGTVLQSGTYWFQLMDSSANRNIVQIWNEDRTQLIRTILTIPNYRLQPTGDTVVKFAERPSGTPEAVKAWFCLPRG
jgi:hypothetical protein